MLRKGHPLLPRINEAIAAQRVLIQRLLRKYITFRQKSECKLVERKMQSLCKFLL